MASEALAVERAVLLQDRKALEPLAEACERKEGRRYEALCLAMAIVEADFERALRSPAAAHVLGTPTTDDETDFRAAHLLRMRTFLASAEGAEDERWAALSALFVGVASLQAFMQHNWTGPALPFEPRDLLPTALRNNAQADDSAILSALSADGEEAYRLVPHPVLLLIARTVLVDCGELLACAARTLPWWRARVYRVQQELLAEFAGSLVDGARDEMRKVVEDTEFLSTDKRELFPRAHIEMGLIHFEFADVVKAKECFERAREASGLELEMTGILGKRTRFQTKEIAQLVLNAASTEGDVYGDAKEGGDAQVPQTLPLNDDTLLEKIALSGDADKALRNLRIIDQAIVIAFCLNVKNSNPKHGLVTEEMFPYVHRVLENPNNWMVYSMALLLRSRLEGEKSRTVERGVLQLQVLVDQYADKEPAAAERLRYLHSLAFPSRWRLQRELGERFLALGVARTAMDIFERLEMWEQYVTCLRVMEKDTKAEEIVRARLAVESTPRMWCLLGDITNDESAYQKAWELSGKRFPRAQRSLGRIYLHAKKYPEAIQAFELALEINTAMEGVWFSLGCAAMNIGDWQRAIRALRRCITLSQEDGEAWNNLATVYIKTKDMERAHGALNEAVKIRYDSWKMWENFLFVSIDVCALDDAIRAYNRLIDLKDKYLDLKALDALVERVLDKTLTSDAHERELLVSKTATLLGRISSNVTNNEDMWATYARFHYTCGNKEKGLDCLLRRYRATQKAGWDSDRDGFKRVARAALDLAEAYLEEGSERSANSARLFLQSLVKSTESKFFDMEEHGKLQEMLDRVKKVCG